MAHDDIRLSEFVERGALGGPGFKTNVTTSDSGDEQRNQEWTRTRAEYDISYGVLRMEDDGLVVLAVEEILKFYYMRRGALRSFLFKDWSDYKIGDPVTPADTSAQVIADGDDTTGPFQVVQLHSDGVAPDFNRIINKIVSGTLTVYNDSTELFDPADYSITALGVITLIAALDSTGGAGPGGVHQLKVNCEFDVPVRFDENDEVLRISVIWAQAGEIPQLNVFEVKDPQ
jgi:uncharacterized protein (TIGR02217 family)